MLFVIHKEDFRYYFLSIITGTCAGLVGSCFYLIVDKLSGWPSYLTKHLEKNDLLFAGFLIGATMIFISRMMVQSFCPEAAGSGVQEIEGALIERRPLRWQRVLLVKFFGGLLSLSSGLVLGREGPTIHIGAAIANGFSNILSCPPLERRGLLAAGAAAGLASAFNAPLAAVLFIMEETRQQFPYTLKTYMGVILAAVTGALITQGITGSITFMKIVQIPPVPIKYFFLFFCLGLCLGIFGVVFNRILVRCLDLSDHLTKMISPYVLPPLIGGITGMLIFIFPASTGAGENLILHLTRFHHEFLLETLFLLVLLRWIMTLASYITGVPGGIFAPILTLAACFGFFFSYVINLIIPLPSFLPVSLAVASMGGLFAGSIRAPIVGAIVVLELTDSYNIMLPVIITCCIANIMAHSLGGEPIYEQLLERTLRLSNATNETISTVKHSKMNS